MIRKLFYFLTVLTLVLFTTAVHAQFDSTETKKPARDKPPLKDRLYFGGSIGLQFGNQTYIDISPLVGYKVTEKFSTGFGITYTYYREHYPQSPQYDYQTNIYGGRVFSRYFFIPNLFGHVEVELLNMEVPTISYTYERKNILSPFIGGGYVQRMGESSGIYIMLLYNINETPDSPYTNPIVRIGVNIGI